MQITINSWTVLYGAGAVYGLVHIIFGIIRHVRMLRQPEIQDVPTFPIFGMFCFRILLGFPVFWASVLIQAVWIPVWNLAWLIGVVGCKITANRSIRYQHAPRWSLGMIVNAMDLRVLTLSAER